MGTFELQPCPHRRGSGDPLVIGDQQALTFHCDDSNELVTAEPIVMPGRPGDAVAFVPRNCAECQGTTKPILGRIWSERFVTPSDRLIDECRMRWRAIPPLGCSLPSVTLACIDCVNPSLAAMALDVSCRGLTFARVVLFSHEPPQLLPKGIEWVRIEKLDKDGYNLFTLRHLHRYVATSHILTIQTDGFILRPELWDDAWLTYDYIGAPWQAQMIHAGRSRVGNSGCCLRSKNLLHATDEACCREVTKMGLSWGGRLLDDVTTCNILYPMLFDQWKYGPAPLRIAPPNIAARFAIEEATEFGEHLTWCFGFHGVPHAPARLLPLELSAWEKRTRWREAGGKIRVVTGMPNEATWRQWRKACDGRLCELSDAHNERHRVIGKSSAIFDDDSGRRATFASLVNFFSDEIIKNDITVLINADCYVDESIFDAALMGPDDFWCLTRRDKTPQGWQLWDVPYSQDAWVFRGPPKFKPEHLQFPPGTVGCDNVIAYQAREAGYRVSNPSRDVRVYHLHADVSKRSMLPRLPGPYLFVKPHRLGEEPETRVITDLSACTSEPDWMGKSAP